MAHFLGVLAHYDTAVLQKNIENFLDSLQLLSRLNLLLLSKKLKRNNSYWAKKRKKVAIYVRKPHCLKYFKWSSPNDGAKCGVSKKNFKKN